ncbi:hypothetical protein ACFLXH_03545 [Chloroflexota bacterium]
MALLREVKRNKKKLEKKFPRQTKRSQFNFTRDSGIMLAVKVLAQRFGIPVYVRSEHALRLGMSEVMTVIKDEVSETG